MEGACEGKRVSRCGEVASMRDWRVGREEKSGRGYMARYQLSGSRKRGGENELRMEEVLNR